MPKIPHLVQYQGSKRILATQILAYMPAKFGRLIEPFSGMAAISIAAARNNRAASYHLNDVNAPLIGMLREVIEFPEKIAMDYEKLWQAQFNCPDNHAGHFFAVREKFNSGDTEPAIMLYLLARCVKGSVRYGKQGNFNQSPDKRRHGTRPANMAENIRAIASLMRGKTFLSACDYKEILKDASKGDIVYMDPPYQGVCAKRDGRYYSAIEFGEFCAALDCLNKRNIDFLVSYDGACGEKSYGQDLPPNLECVKYLLNAGKSTQQTLLGKNKITYEALYVSKNLAKKVNFINKNIQMNLL